MPAFPEKRSKGKCEERARTKYSCQAVEVFGFLPRWWFVLVFGSVLKTNFSTLRNTTIRHTQKRRRHTAKELVLNAFIQVLTLICFRLYFLCRLSAMFSRGWLWALADTMEFSNGCRNGIYIWSFWYSYWHRFGFGAFFVPMCWEGGWECTQRI